MPFCHNKEEKERREILKLTRCSKPVTLSHARHFPDVSCLHDKLQYLPGAENILFVK
jgi:hypothetical protein